MRKIVINGYNLRSEWNAFKKLSKVFKWMKKLEDKERWAAKGIHNVNLPYSRPETMLPIPKVGETRHFFDDGKVKESRHYIGTVTEVIPYKRASQKLKKTWKKERWSCYWLYAYETDYFIKMSIPKYDEKPIYFARTKDGGWFSIDFMGWWMSGRLMAATFDWDAYLEEQRRELEALRNRKNIKQQ